MLMFISIFMLLVSSLNPPSHGYYPALNNNLILAGIDSLTQRGPDPGGQGFFKPYRDLMKAKYGDGGPGYIDFDTHGVDSGNFELIRSSGLQNISSVTAGEYPSQYSLDLKGSYSNATDENLSIDLHATWDTGKIYYLIQPDGGSFEINGVPISAAGSISLGVYTLPTTTSSQILIDHINGKVAIFGGLFLNNTGIAVTRIGKGGDSLNWHMRIDIAFRTQWISELKPKMLLLNSGTNDYLQYQTSPEEYQNELINFITPYVTQRTKVVLIRQNLMELNNDIYDGYELKQKELQSEPLIQCISNKTVLGDSYQDEVINGYMGDTIHPNQIGYDKIARNIFDILSKQ